MGGRLLTYLGRLFYGLFLTEMRDGDGKVHRG